MKTTDLNDLLATIEAVRRDKHPSLRPEFLVSVVEAVQAHLDDEAEAVRKIERALNALLAMEMPR
jgi:hypothetical protein